MPLQGVTDELAAVGERHEEAAAHDAKVSGLLSQASQAAATAAQSASEAQQVAATARGAADEANEHAKRAHESATQASEFARQAHGSALEAEESARQAASSAATAARTAAAAADSASRSAIRAQSSANSAASSANTALKAKRAAYDSAIAAGKDEAAARTAADQALGYAVKKYNDERARFAFENAYRCSLKNKGDASGYQDCISFLSAGPQEQMQIIYSRGRFCAKTYGDHGPDFKACIANATTPEFAADQAWTIVGKLSDYLGVWASGLAASLGALGCALLEPCGVLALSIVPEGMALLPFIEVGAGGLLGSAIPLRVYEGLKTAAVENGALSSLLANEARISMQLTETERLRRLGFDWARGGEFKQHEFEMAVLIEKQFGIRLTRWPDKNGGPDWVGSDGKFYDGIGPIPSAAFDQEWSLGQIQTSILRHVRVKADYVPIDTRGLTPEQIQKLKDFIRPHEPFVFILR
ncbi:hypothetical protein [Amycolatopsis sp. NPDC049868]|uniref:hypothetical protein n=1 Tax=Amycolatopsis sp. NPDC049868 TaxID=3363934 RepID=UPI0037B73D64